MHVDDYCRGIERGSPGAVNHIDGETSLSNRELTAAILSACGASWDMAVPVADRKGHDRRYSLDDSLLRSWAMHPGWTSSPAWP